MTEESKAGGVRDPRARQRDLGPAAGAVRPKAASSKQRKRKRKSTRTPGVPSQSRDESREQPQDLQDVERDVAAGEERYDVERE
jgi:hypothetical protein